MSSAALAQAHANIALAKYWGKRDTVLNLPAVGSISITLEALATRTMVQFNKNLARDRLILNGQPADQMKTRRVSKFLDLIRTEAGINDRALVESENNFPTGAGLASSASAFAALALAGSQAAGLTLDQKSLSVMARQGSGSAARSIYGGFCEMQPGQLSDGSDACAIPLAAKNYWDLQVLIAITSEQEKSTGSTDGMQLSAETSPYYKSWVASTHTDLDQMRLAIKDKDFKRLGELSEYSCLKMHAVMLSSRPALIYWNEITMHLINLCRTLRYNGMPVYFTIDAGPQVKLITKPDHVADLKSEINKITGVQRIISSSLGPDAHLVEAQK